MCIISKKYIENMFKNHIEEYYNKLGYLGTEKGSPIAKSFWNTFKLRNVCELVNESRINS